MNAIDTFDFEHDGMNFRASIFHYEFMGAPWDEHDGHGEVSEWTTRAKLPGEMVLCYDRRSNRYYDFQGTVTKALREGWGFADSEGLTKRQVAAKAAMEDFNRLRAWCNGYWHWIGIAVDLLDDDGEQWSYQTGDNSYIGDCYGYPHWATAAVYRDSIATDVAQTLIDELEDCLY